MNSMIVFVIAAIAGTTMAGRLSPVSVSQDTLGNYELQYQLADSSRLEHAAQGNELLGKYAFVDKEGGHHEVAYSSGKAGFVAHSASLPVAPLLTPEVAHATAEFHAVYDEVARNLPVLTEDELEGDDIYHYVPAVEKKLVRVLVEKPEYYVVPTEHKRVEKVVLINGVPQDTEEVAQAKKAHLAAYSAAIKQLIH